MNKVIEEIKLGEIAEFRNGLNFSSDNHGKGCPLIGVSDFKNRSFPDYSSLAEVNPEGIVKDEDYVSLNDVLFVRSNGNKDLVGRSLFIDKDIKALFSGFCIRARINPSKLNPLFFAYFTKTTRFRSFISFASGTNIQNLNQQILSAVKVPLLAKKEQEKIIHTLLSIDSKIKLNNKINAELEAMAKLIYDYWFVQFDFPDANGKPYKSSGGKMVYNETLKREIPEGWTNGTLNELGDIVGGSTPSTSNPENFTANGTPWLTPKDLSQNVGNKFITRGAQDISDLGLKSASLKKYPKGTVLISSRAPIGYMAIARESLTMNQGFKSFIPTKGFSTSFIYYTVKNSMKAIIQYSSGSTFKEVSGATLRTVKVCLPPFKVTSLYSKQIESIFSRQNLLELENQKLTELRDWLLPMLMNGQVTVEDDKC